MSINDIAVSRAIVETYNAKLLDALDVDVLIAGAGPSGMVAAAILAEQGFKVSIIEKRLSIGGGIWGGGLMMPIVVIQPEARHVLDKFGIRYQSTADGLLTVEATELACALCVGAVRAGAHLLTLMNIEDVRVQKDRVTGLVVNRTHFGAVPLPVDPITLGAKVVIDQTGHDMVVAAALQKRGLRLQHEYRQADRRRPHGCRPRRAVCRREDRLGLPRPLRRRNVRLCSVRRPAHGPDLRRYVALG